MRFWRIVGIVIGVVVIVIVGLVVRTLNAAGVFAELKPVSPGVCRDIAGVAGAEDLQIDRKSGTMFISSNDWRAFQVGKAGAGNGIYALDLAKPDGTPVRLDGAPAVFHPHGLSLYRAPNGAETLMVVNHPMPGKSEVDIFDIVRAGDGALSLHQRAAVSGQLLFSANDVVAVGADRFYATNDHGSRTQMGAMLEMYALLPRASVVYYDGNAFRTVAEGMRFANGINVSPDYSRLYVSESTGRRIDTFTRDVISGDLTAQGDFEIASGLDNIDVDEAGNLWIGSHPKMLALLDYGTDPKKPSPSEITKVTVTGGMPASAETVYENDGSQIGASSVGAAFNGHLYIGSIFDPKILDCTLAH